MLENKAANHFDGAIRSWTDMKGRNDRIMYRVARAADAHLQLYLLGGHVDNLTIARSYLPPMSEGLPYIREDNDREFVVGVIQSIKGTPLPSRS